MQALETLSSSQLVGKQGYQVRMDQKSQIACENMPNSLKNA